jgi:hypothetical protein
MKNLFILLSVAFVGFILGGSGMAIALTGTALTFKMLGVSLAPKGSLGVSICGEINGNIEFDCNNPLQNGTRDRAWIINHDDIDVVAFDATNKNIVTDITLKATKLAYYVDGKNNSIAPTTALVRLAYSTAFDHMVNMKGFDISPVTKDMLDKAKDGRFVVITENNFKGATGNSAFEIYGLTTGLEMTVLDRDPLNADTQGAFNFTFGTDKNKEPNLPKTFFITSYAASKTAIEALLS